MLQSAHAQQVSRQKLPVVVGGKRVKTIDVHAHCHFREAGAVGGCFAPKFQLPPVNGAAEAFIEIDKRLAASLFGGYLLGAVLMVAAGVIAAFFAVSAERRPLEEVARPLGLVD